jgi:hypothetical protein
MVIYFTSHSPKAFIPFMIDTIQKMTYNENDEIGKIMKWYLQLKSCLRHVPAEKNLASSGN